MTHTNSYLTLKRFFDLLFSILLIISLFPLFLLIAALIYFEDKGNPIFTQVRAGRNHIPFMLYKFRSMKLNTPNLSTADLQRSGINPITKIGYFLRKSSLDELPQLLNILQGKMSFIGPRPALMSQEFILKGREITQVNTLYPGITGLAQVNGRDDLSDQEKIKLDAQYLENLGLFQDIKILINTVKAVTSTTGNK
jgi:lipopolysaccharide/colanic/teichoic acid biosynthesis glycosyltransferase